MFRIAFATGSRADYGIVRDYLKKLDQDEQISLSLMITGAAADSRYGNLMDTIQEDGFQVSHIVPLPLDNKTVTGTLSDMAIGLERFGQIFFTESYDLLILLGDRYEIYSIAIAATMNRIKILHLHGGEITYANYDEFIRHSITKMSWYHIASTETYQKRIIQMGENPDYVFYGGALGAENCLYIDKNNVSEKIKSLSRENYFVILFHPETMNPVPPKEQVKSLLGALRSAKVVAEYIFIGSNADTGADAIVDQIKIFCRENRNAQYFVNLHPDGYHYLLKSAIALIGNSSSGIIEAPSLGIPTVNIGNRQRGRVKGASVFDVNCDSDSIRKKIELIYQSRPRFSPLDNPYYRKGAADYYYETTIKLLREKPSEYAKEFFDNSLLDATNRVHIVDSVK